MISCEVGKLASSDWISRRLFFANWKRYRLLLHYNLWLTRYRLSPSYTHIIDTCAHRTSRCSASAAQVTQQVFLPPAWGRLQRASTKPPLAVAVSPRCSCRHDDCTSSMWERKGRDSRQTKSTCGSLYCAKRRREMENAKCRRLVLSMYVSTGV